MDDHKIGENCVFDIILDGHVDAKDPVFLLDGSPVIRAEFGILVVEVEVALAVATVLCWLLLRVFFIASGLIG